MTRENTIEKLIQTICDFGDGETEFDTKDIEWLIRELQAADANLERKTADFHRSWQLFQATELKLKMAKEALIFYASPKNWSRGYCMIHDADRGDIKEPDPRDCDPQGRIAREALKRLEK